MAVVGLDRLAHIHVAISCWKSSHSSLVILVIDIASYVAAFFMLYVVTRAQPRPFVHEHHILSFVLVHCFIVLR